MDAGSSTYPVKGTADGWNSRRIAAGGVLVNMLVIPWRIDLIQFGRPRPSPQDPGRGGGGGGGVFKKLGVPCTARPKTFLPITSRVGVAFTLPNHMTQSAQPLSVGYPCLPTHHPDVVWLHFQYSPHLELSALIQMHILLQSC